MDIRYSCNQKDFKRYTTEEMRDEMLITGLYKADEVVAVYSHVDRMVTDRKSTRLNSSHESPSRMPSSA